MKKISLMLIVFNFYIHSSQANPPKNQGEISNEVFASIVDTEFSILRLLHFTMENDRKYYNPERAGQFFVNEFLPRLNEVDAILELRQVKGNKTRKRPNHAAKDLTSQVAISQNNRSEAIKSTNEFDNFEFNPNFDHDHDHDHKENTKRHKSKGQSI